MPDLRCSVATAAPYLADRLPVEVLGVCQLLSEVWDLNAVDAFVRRLASAPAGLRRATRVQPGAEPVALPRRRGSSHRGYVAGNAGRGSSRAVPRRRSGLACRPADDHAA